MIYLGSGIHSGERFISTRIGFTESQDSFLILLPARLPTATPREYPLALNKDMLRKFVLACRRMLANQHRSSTTLKFAYLTESLQRLPIVGWYGFCGVIVPQQRSMQCGRRGVVREYIFCKHNYLHIFAHSKGRDGNMQQVIVWDASFYTVCVHGCFGIMYKCSLS
jgi:hypothetical protein